METQISQNVSGEKAEQLAEHATGTVKFEMESNPVVKTVSVLEEHVEVELDPESIELVSTMDFYNLNDEFTFKSGLVLDFEGVNPHHNAIVFEHRELPRYNREN
jgi:hypothetical protein